jgi:hypothetical protein
LCPIRHATEHWLETEGTGGENSRAVSIKDSWDTEWGVAIALGWNASGVCHQDKVIMTIDVKVMDALYDRLGNRERE